jgi:hypothetical protein
MLYFFFQSLDKTTQTFFYRKKHLEREVPDKMIIEGCKKAGKGNPACEKKKKIEEANWSSLSTTDIGGLLHHQTKLTFVFTTLLLTSPTRSPFRGRASPSVSGNPLLLPPLLSLACDPTALV